MTDLSGAKCTRLVTDVLDWTRLGSQEGRFRVRRKIKLFAKISLGMPGDGKQGGWAGWGMLGWADIGSWQKTSWDMLPHPGLSPPPAVAPAGRAMLTYEGKFRRSVCYRWLPFICSDTRWRAHTGCRHWACPEDTPGRELTQAWLLPGLWQGCN